MFRSVVAIIFVAVSQLGCCCVDFMQGFNKGFNRGLQRAQQEQADQDKRAKVDEEQKRKTELQQLINQNLGANTFQGMLAPGNPFWGKLRQTTIQRQYVTNKSIGEGRDKPFSDVHPDGGVLIGVFAGEDDAPGNVIVFLQPIYLTSQGEKVGQAYGSPRGQVKVLKARSGYAVGGATVRMGAIMDAVTLRFMRVQGDRLNLADSYDSIQAGGNGGGPQTFMSTGSLLVGIHGKQNENENFSPAGSPNSLGFYSLP